MYKMAIKIFGVALVFTGLYFFCEQETQGFRLYHLLSDLPDDPCWEIPSLEPEENKKIYHLLDQTFTYIGKGGFCYAFLGEDQKTVIKFPAHHHLNLLSILKNFSWEKVFLKCSIPASSLSLHQQFFFQELQASIYASKATDRASLYPPQ